MRQRLQQCVVVSPWDAGELFARLARTVDRELPDVAAFVVDDTGFHKAMGQAQPALEAFLKPWSKCTYAPSRRCCWCVLGARHVG